MPLPLDGRGLGVSAVGGFPCEVFFTDTSRSRRLAGGMVALHLVSLLLVSAISVSAQFNIFDQFFGGGHQHAQQQQSRGVDWYKQHHDAGTQDRPSPKLPPNHLSSTGTVEADFQHNAHIIYVPTRYPASANQKIVPAHWDRINVRWARPGIMFV